MIIFNIGTLIISHFLAYQQECHETRLKIGTLDVIFLQWSYTFPLSFSRLTKELFCHIVMHGANKVDRSCYQNFICICAKRKTIVQLQFRRQFYTAKLFVVQKYHLTSCCIDFVVGRTQYIINRLSQVDCLSFYPSLK